MPYSEFKGAETETVHEYEDGRLVRSVTEPRWTEMDRGLVLALLADRAETCSQCDHPMSMCRDPKSAGQWQVLQDVCQASRVAQAVAEDVHKTKKRGVVLSTRRN